MSQLKVNTIRHTGASSDAIELNSDGSCTVKATNRSSNLIINGAMNVAQYGTTSTTNGYNTVDRWNNYTNNADEAGTFSQASISSGNDAYNAGFRNCLKVVNGNQTSGVGTEDFIQLKYTVESQDVANSGWNTKSTSSYITFSFWIKSSVAQAFSGSLRTNDGTAYSYKFSTPSLSADTWTKVTKTIPGNSNLDFNDDNGIGLQIYLYPYLGTNYTSSDSNTETWITGQTNTYANDITGTWWTTNDATFEITGVQLEVGDFASDFCHEPYSETLRKCQRYYQTITGGVGVGEDSTTTIVLSFCYPVEMRATPSFSTTGVLTFEEMNDADRTQSSGHASVRSNRDNSRGACLNLSNFSGIQKDQPYPMSPNHSGNDNRIALNAEL